MREQPWDGMPLPTLRDAILHGTGEFSTLREQLRKDFVGSPRVFMPGDGGAMFLSEASATSAPLREKDAREVWR